MIQVLCINPVQAMQAMQVQVWPWIKANTTAQRAVVLEARLADDKKSDRQRRYLHGVVLLQIAKQARVNGASYPLAVWKEHFRAEYLGFKTVTSINPMTGKKHRRRVRISTEDLGVKAYAAYIERVTAFAVTELGVEFGESHLHIDPDTGEIYQ